MLDFQNDTETIEKSFADYYRTTILSNETDPNKLHTLKGELDQHQVYAPEQIDALVELFLSSATREKLDPILDACVAVYVENLDEDQQVDFKGRRRPSPAPMISSPRFCLTACRSGRSSRSS